MACFFPVPAWPDLNTGEWVFSWSPKRELGAQIMTACRQCEGCRSTYAASWALRAMHEARFHESNCFLSLTYDDASFPRSQNAWVHDMRSFVKRLRKHAGAELKTFGCLELGDNTRRPHGHVLVFGVDFPRDEGIARGSAGEVCYRSDQLDALWRLGHASVGDLTEQSAGYVARYAMKKRAERDSLGEFETVVHPAGFLVQLRPAMSIARSRGLGYEWFRLYGEQAVREGCVTLAGGVRVPIPDGYVRKAAEWFPGVGADAQCVALERAAATAWDRVPERLAVRLQVQRAKQQFLKRGGL